MNSLPSSCIKSIIGLDMFHVQQRTYRQLFKFQDYSTLTGHVSFYYREPRTNVLNKLSVDTLQKIQIYTRSRRFKSGASVGVYFSRTDVSSFEFGEGSLIRVFILQFLCKYFSRIIERDIYHLA